MNYGSYGGAPQIRKVMVVRWYFKYLYKEPQRHQFIDLIWDGQQCDFTQHSYLYWSTFSQSHNASRESDFLFLWQQAYLLLAFCMFFFNFILIFFNACIGIIIILLKNALHYVPKKKEEKKMTTKKFYTSDTH